MARSSSLFCLFFLFVSCLFSQSSTVSIQNTSTYLNDSLIIPISATNLNNVGAITLKVQYDPNSLIFASVENWNTQFPGALSGDRNNTIVLAWDGLTPANLANGKLADLKFFHKSGDCILSFIESQCEIADINGKTLNAVYSGGKITSIPIPQIPNLDSPENNKTNCSTEIILKWNKTENAKKYTLQISKDNNFANIIFNDSTLTDTLASIKGISNKSKFYWRVKAQNPSGCSQFSDIWNFTTIIAPPGKPTLLLPDNNIKEQPTSLFFNWSPIADAENYNLQISTDQNFQNVFISDSLIISIPKQVAGLKQGVQYYWRVRAKNISGAGPFSEIRNFLTLLPAPENLSALVQDDRKIKLTWIDKSDNESGFTLERKLNSEISFTMIDTIKADLTEYTDSTLKPGTAYSYRINAFSAYTNSKYSNEISAKTTTFVNNNIDAVPTDYYLYQNYPNPFNPGTTIKYSIPTRSSINIRIINALGEVIYKSDIVQSQGSYEIFWNANNITSGTYYCVLEAKSFDGMRFYRSVNKMLLIK